MKVNMLSAARDAQWNAQTFMGLNAVKAVAPAKVNLFLNIGSRRGDGYHNVDTVLHSLSLHDVLYVHRKPLSDTPACEDSLVYALGGPAENLCVMIDCASKIADQGGEALQIPAKSNMVFLAIDALARAVGYDRPEQISVRVEKAIPHEAGLGGGSSDAAAVLAVLAQEWGINEADARVEEVARTLGADVAFFLRGGCAEYGGRGDVLVRAITSMKKSLVLVKPAVGVPTPLAYQCFDKNPAKANDALVEQMKNAQAAHEMPLFNGMTAVAESIASELACVRAWLAEQPGVVPDTVLLCGSGASTFALTNDAAAATNIAAAAQARGWWARATAFSSLRATRLPR